MEYDCTVYINVTYCTNVTMPNEFVSGVVDSAAALGFRFV